MAKALRFVPAKHFPPAEFPIPMDPLNYPSPAPAPGQSGAGETLVVVDTYSLLFQVFHALPPMTSPSGLPTNALFGMARDLVSLRARKPGYLVCAVDLGGPTFRHAIYPEYKSHRPPMPPELAAQIPWLEKLMDALAIPRLGVEGYEADDLLATLATEASQKGMDTLLCTSDKDCRQLLGPHVRLYNLRKDTYYTATELKADWGVTPDRVIDLQALVGDTADHIPGAPGVGPKTAQKWLEEFGSLDGLHANLDKIPGKKGQVLKENWDKVELSRKLVRLEPQVPIALEWDAWKLREPDAAKAHSLFKELGFRSLANLFDLAARGAGPVPSSQPVEPPRAAVPKGRGRKPAGGQGDLFASVVEVDGGEPGAGAPALAEPVPDGWDYTGYELVNAPERWTELLAAIRGWKRFAFDLETTSLNPMEAKIVGVALCREEGRAHYVALRGPLAQTSLDPEKVIADLKPVFEDAGIEKVNQNIKYEYLVLAAHGIHLRGLAGDPMVADYLLHAGERSHGLDELSWRYLAHRMIPITELIGKAGRKQPQKRMDEVDVGQVARYACEDADAAWRLTGKLEALLGAGDESTAALPAVYRELEVPLIGVLARMEAEGVKIDTPRLEQLGREMGAELQEIEAKIHGIVGRSFNIQSLPQLRQVLFDELKLPAQKRTGVTGEASTDQETLERLATLDLPGCDVPRLLLRHRQVSKLKGTYVDALPALADAQGRIHASFNQTVAATGRLSSSDPNLQNIPVRREMGQQIRQAFIARPGWRLIAADYSQIELRLLAHLSGDEALLQAFADKVDVHAAVAAELYGVPLAQVDDGMRRTAKMVNFGVIYGISAFGLAARLGIGRAEAGAFIDAYFAKYPAVLEWQEKLLRQAHSTGTVHTLLGRMRRIEGVRADSSYRQRNQPEREAINMEVQGSAADLIKLAMLEVDRMLPAEGFVGRMVLQIHDELVVEAPEAEVDRLAQRLHACMAEALSSRVKLKVSLEVDVATGPNWLDVEEIKIG